MVYTSQSEEETLKVAKKIAKGIKPGSKIQLTGDLGAGKSFLVRQILIELGFQGLVPSPTFTLINSYAIQEQVIHHCDVYRLSDESELYDMGLEEYIKDDSILFVEWSDKFPDFFSDLISIKIEMISPTERKITME